MYIFDYIQQCQAAQKMGTSENDRPVQAFYLSLQIQVYNHYQDLVY